MSILQSHSCICKRCCWSFWFQRQTSDSKSIQSESQRRQTSKKAETEQCSHRCSLCTPGKAPFPLTAIPRPRDITANTSNQVGRCLIWLSKAWVSLYPDSMAWQVDAMTFISSTNTYLETKNQALGYTYSSFLPRYICLPNKGYYLCPHTLACLGCLRPPWSHQPQPLGKAAVLTSA